MALAQSGGVSIVRSSATISAAQHFPAMPSAPWLPSVTPTPLVDATKLAGRCGVAHVFIKDETQRALGNFKSLGGLRAALSALDRAIGAGPESLALREKLGDLPPFICASAGNHGLAVAAAAKLAGTSASIYLYDDVSPERVVRLVKMGAQIVHVSGTFDDAVDAARAAAERGEGLLIADTSTQANDEIVNDVIAGYGDIAAETLSQLKPDQRLTHVFVQAGVGGLAAGLAAGLNGHASGRPWLVVVEPTGAACVAAALQAGKPVRLPGALSSAASMLACGEASAPALAILKRHHPAMLAVDDAKMVKAAHTMAQLADIETTPSGAAGLAGLLAATESPLGERLGLDASSQILIVATEGLL